MPKKDLRAPTSVKRAAMITGPAESRLEPSVRAQTSQDVIAIVLKHLLISQLDKIFYLSSSPASEDTNLEDGVTSKLSHAIPDLVKPNMNRSVQFDSEDIFPE